MINKEIKTSTGLIAIFAAVVVLFGGALTYWYYTDLNSYDTSKDATLVAKISNINDNENSNTNIAYAPVLIPGWETYTNDIYGFSFQHPADWVVEDQSEMYKKIKPALVAIFNSKPKANTIYPYSVMITSNSLLNELSNMRQKTIENGTNELLSESTENKFGQEVTTLLFRTIATNTEGTEYFFSNKNYTFIVPGSSTEDTENAKIVNQMVNTFSLIR